MCFYAPPKKDCCYFSYRLSLLHANYLQYSIVTSSTFFINSDIRVFGTFRTFPLSSRTFKKCYIFRFGDDVTQTKNKNYFKINQLISIKQIIHLHIKNYLFYSILINMKVQYFSRSVHYEISLFYFRFRKNKKSKSFCLVLGIHNGMSQ